MNSNIQVFAFQGQQVRTVIIDGEPWFVGKDVASVLGYQRPADAIAAHVDEEDKLTRQFTDSGQGRDMTIINESGVYSLIFSSQLPTAKQFKHWVTSEVLPALRKTGSFSITDSKPAVRNSKKKDTLLPAHSGGVKAGERIAAKVFKCKKPEDFQAVLAMDEDFKDTFGYSWLERHGFRLVKKMVPTTWEERSNCGCWLWDKKEAFVWEHDYDLDKIIYNNVPF